MKARPASGPWSVMVAASLLLLSLAWTAWSERKVADGRFTTAAMSVANAPPSSQSGNAGAVSTMVWSGPEVERDDASWGFDLFTPPVIYYDRTSGRFSVTPPDTAAVLAEQAAASPFGITLLEVKRERYPLQLVGYAGEPGAYFGIFQNEKTRDAIVAQAGHRFTDLGLVVRTLDVRREDLIVPDSMPLRDIVAVAEVWDETAGRVVRLSSSSWQWTDAPVAQMRIDSTGEEKRVRVGDRIEMKGAAFEVRSVGAVPPRVVVGKRHDDGTREEMTLWPELPAEVQFESDSPPSVP